MPEWVAWLEIFGSICLHISSYGIWYCVGRLSANTDFLRNNKTKNTKKTEALIKADTAHEIFRLMPYSSAIDAHRSVLAYSEKKLKEHEEICKEEDSFYP